MANQSSGQFARTEAMAGGHSVSGSSTIISQKGTSGLEDETAVGERRTTLCPVNWMPSNEAISR
jgi:hypothetical protein